MTLPDGPFFAGRVDLEAAAKVLADNDGIEIIEWHEDLSRRVIKAALVGVEPAEQEERGGFVPSDWHQQRYVTRWKETRR